MKIKSPSQMSKNNNTKCVTTNKEANAMFMFNSCIYVTLVELIWGSPS